MDELRRAPVALVLLVVAGCAPQRGARPILPQPTEHRLDDGAEERNARERRAWIESMHRAAPGVDWKAIERENARTDQARRNFLGRVQAASAAPASWTEVGSSNLAGRMHVAAIAPDGQKLYGGSSLGGVWRGNLDGVGWEPLGDNLWGGAHDLVVLPGENPGEPDVVVAVTDGGLVHVTRNDGVTWEQPAGIGSLWSLRGAASLTDASRTILLFARGPATNYKSTILASTDYGRSFSARWQGTQGWDGWMWVPRTGPGAAGMVYVVDAGRIRVSSDGGFTFPTAVTVAPGATSGVLTGSEAGAPVLYAAFQLQGLWKLYRSANAGQTWSFRYDIGDFWETLCASTLNPDLIAFGGVELYRSTNGGLSFLKINGWGEYYSDPVNKLHADTPGLFALSDPSMPGKENWYVATDGGLYLSENGLASVRNISLSGLAVSQYYSTLSSRGNWDRVSAGAQDQGYQHGIVQHAPGPSTPLVQLISGDYGHLTSGDGKQNLVFSTYPGFTLVQDGPQNPALYGLDFPAGAQHAWLPPVVADPVLPGSFFFCGDLLYRFDRIGTSQWVPAVHSAQRFGGLGADGAYLSALAFAPSAPDRVYAANDRGHLYYSTDHGVTWTESAGIAPEQHYFYGTAITVHPEDPLEVAVGGSGYSSPGVVRSTDGGATWVAETTGLPQTLVYALVYAQDGSGDLYAGTETGAWRWDRGTGVWENIMANTAPATIYWSAEVVNDGGTVRFGTYGRGMWDFARVPGDRDGDGVTDVVDSCPNNADPSQQDADDDAVGDVCDDCPSVADTAQLDSDGDDAGDGCDCAASDPGVFATPSEVVDLRFSSPTRLVWTSALPQSGFDTRHIVYRGALGELPVGSSSTCMTTVLQAASLEDAESPAAASGFWYLVHGVNACGAGTLGMWGAGIERATLVCP